MRSVGAIAESAYATRPAGDDARSVRGQAIDFNSLLQFANLIVAGLLVFVYVQLPDNEYVDRETIALGLLLCAQTFFALLLEGRRRDPLVVLLTFAMVFYYELRIFTLTVYPSSTVFDRYAYDADDSNYALLYIIVANVFLYSGLYVVRFRQGQRIDAGGWQAKSPASVVALLVVAIVFAYTRGAFWNQDNVPRALNFLETFLDPGLIVLMTLSYYWLFRKSLTRGFAFAMVCLIVADIAAHTLYGSRSALIAFVQECMLVALAIAGRIRLRRSYVVWGILLSPVLVALLIVSFVISTYNRVAQQGALSFDVGRSLQTASESGTQLLADTNFDIVLPPIAARAGYFDFSAEIIAHRDQYRPVINLTSYAKSIIDNVLTPGFDVYDQPKTSNALQFIYRGWGEPSKAQVPDYYQSDQLGIYGEFYGLFGYASLPLLLLAAGLLKWAYTSVSSRNPFFLTMQRVIVLLIWARLIDSFGVDWVIGEVIPVIAGVFLYSALFAARPARQPPRGMRSG